MVSSGPSTKAVRIDTVASAGSRRSPRLAQKSRGDGSYSQLRRISSPLTAKKIEHSEVAERGAELVERLGPAEEGEAVGDQHRPGGQQPQEVEVVVATAEPVGQADSLEPLLREAPRGYLGRRGHGAQATNRPSRRIGHHGARR